MPTEATIKIKGYYYSQMVHPNLDRLMLDMELWKPSAGLHILKNLVILDVERIYGGYWNPVKVIAVVDTTRSLIPFFIERQKAERLNELIREADDFIVDL